MCGYVYSLKQGCFSPVDLYESTLKMADVGCSQTWEELKLTWETRKEVPSQWMWRGAAVAHGTSAYFDSYVHSHEVFAYNSEKDEWSKLPNCPQRNFGLAVINNHLTAVGGTSQSGGCTDHLISFNESTDKWEKIFPPMPTKRLLPTVISTQKYLITAGGEQGENNFSTVELMDMNTLEWYTAARLPEPVDNMSATICGGRLYLLGGLDNNGRPTHAVFTCTIDSLVSSCHPSSQTPSHTSETSVWKRVTDVPLRGSTCTTLNGRVLAIGGYDSDGAVSAAVHMYDAKSDKWHLMGHMPTARSNCLVVALHNRIITVGGNTAFVAVEVSTGRLCSIVELGGEGVQFPIS